MSVHIYEDPNKKNKFFMEDVVFEKPELFFEKSKFQFQNLEIFTKPALLYIFGYLILLNISILSLVRKVYLQNFVFFEKHILGVKLCVVKKFHKNH